jgi:predicted dehydrogenase
MPGVDASFEIDLEFGSGASGAVRCSMEGARERLQLTIIGSSATMTVHNFVLPHRDDRVSVRNSAGVVVEHVGQTSSYTHQLAAFAPYLAGRTDKPPVHPEESLAIMRMIDEALLAAGWQSRKHISTKTT